MPKLNDGHIRKTKIRKMRVNYAAQTLSRTASSFIRLLTCLTGLSSYFSEHYVFTECEKKTNLSFL